ncbi:hypothetical protein GIB67_023788, partial [Kingdonia uniflora]
MILIAEIINNYCRELLYMPTLLSKSTIYDNLKTVKTCNVDNSIINASTKLQ